MLMTLIRIKSSILTCKANSDIILMFTNTVMVLQSSYSFLMVRFITLASKRSTFEKVEQWITECESCDAPIRILIGNKIDLVMTKKNVTAPVTKVEGLALAKKYGMEYFEASSTGEASIIQLFDYLFNALLGLIPNPPDPEAVMGKNVVIGNKVLTDV